MVVNVDKDAPEKIVDALQRFQFPFKEDKITVIANGCAISPDPKSVMVRERSRSLDGG